MTKYTRRALFPALGILTATEAFAQIRPETPRPGTPTPTQGPIGPIGPVGPIGPIGPQGPQGIPGEKGICECLHPRVSMQWDGKISLIFQGQRYFAPEIMVEDITGTVPGAKRHDEFVFWPRYKAMLYIDHNHVSGIPHAIIFKQPHPWKRIHGIGPQLLSYMGNNGLKLHQCIVSLDKTLHGAQLFLPWTPLTNFTTFGEFKP